MPEQDLRMRAKGEGFDEVAADLEKVDQAQKKVGATGEKQVGTAKKAKQEQDKLNASTSDYAELLGRIHPALGMVAMSAVQGARVLGDLANRKIDVTGVAKKMVGALGSAGKAIKLLGATGVAVAGLTVLYKVISKLREEAQRFEEAIRKMIAAQTEWATKSIEDAKAVAAARDEAGRWRKPFTFAQQESVRKTLAAAPDKLREKLKPITEALGGARGFGTAPGEFRGAELEALARLGWQPEPGAPQDYNSRRATWFLDRREDHIRIIEDRQRDDRAAARRRAVQEALADGIEGHANLRGILKEKIKGLGLDEQLDRLTEILIAQIREDVQPRAGETEYEFFELHSTPGARRTPAFPTRPRGVQVFESPIWHTGGPVAGGASVTPPEAVALTEALRELTTEVRNVNLAGPSYGIQINNGVDARARRGRETYGAMIGRAKE